MKSMDYSSMPQHPPPSPFPQLQNKTTRIRKNHNNSEPSPKQLQLQKIMTNNKKKNKRLSPSFPQKQFNKLPIVLPPFKIKIIDSTKYEKKASYVTKNLNTHLNCSNLDTNTLYVG